jgi:hypothetical protein
VAKKRDSDYFVGRLKAEHPAIYDDLRAGRIKSVRQAAAKAGLIHLPTRVDALKREWKRASPSQRQAFLTWVKVSRVGLKRKPAKAPRVAIDGSGRLTPDAIAFIRKWTSDRSVRPGQIMKQIGESNFDYTLAAALKGGRLRDEVHTSLTAWLNRHGFS